MQNNNHRGAVFMIIAMATFAANDTCIKAVTQNLPLGQVIFLRGLLMLIPMWLMARQWGGFSLRLGRHDTKVMGWRLVGEVGATLLFLTALQYMPLASLTAIMQALPLAMTLLAALIYKEAIGWRRMAAVTIGFGGVMLIVNPAGSDFGVWSIVGIAAMLAVVLRDMATRHFTAAVPSVMIGFHAAWAVTLLGAVMIPLQGWKPVSITDLAWIIGAAVFLISGYITVIFAMRSGQISVVAPFRYTAMIWAIGLGYITFGDLPTFWELVGAGIVVATGIYTFHREAIRAKAG